MSAKLLKHFVGHGSGGIKERNEGTCSPPRLQKSAKLSKKNDTKLVGYTFRGEIYICQNLEQFGGTSFRLLRADLWMKIIWPMSKTKT